MTDTTLVQRLREADANSPQRIFGSRIFGEAADEIDRLTAELAEARKVIEPFVWGDPAIEQILFGDQPDTASVTFTIPFGAIRAARSFLEGKS